MNTQPASEAERALQEQVEALRRQLQEKNARRQPPKPNGPCAAITQQDEPCLNFGRYERDGKYYCGSHTFSRKTNWQVRVLQNADAGRAVSLNRDEVREVADLIRSTNPHP
jgi:hypothetical protein